MTLFNDVDNSSPPTSFRFINQSELGQGVTRTTDEWMSGCACRKDNGRNIGCEYLSCECLGDSALNPETGKRVFPYAAGKHDFGCLRDFYLESRHHIYECNKICNCEANCKNRLVQRGKTVPLEIFKTVNRGWGKLITSPILFSFTNDEQGLRCKVDLKKGQFIDTYRGEIITSEEANNRGKVRSLEQENYLFDLDKFEGDIAEDVTIYTCDGKQIGGPTRFINHSCDPNCRLFTVSYNHADISIYDLAFFTIEFIPAGTELTFDYQDSDDRTVITKEMAKEMEKEKGYPSSKCLCGTKYCREYFFN